MSDVHVNQVQWNAAPGGDARDEIARAAASALGEIASNMNGLGKRIEEAAGTINHALIVSTSEVEIGKLFARAQEFVDQAVADAQEQASQLLADARAEASRIVDEAHYRAQQIMGQASTSRLLPPEAAQQLERTIESFSKANSELAEELVQLNKSLAPQNSGNGHSPRNSIFAESTTSSAQQYWAIQDPATPARAHTMGPDPIAS